MKSTEDLAWKDENGWNWRVLFFWESIDTTADTTKLQVLSNVLLGIEVSKIGSVANEKIDLRMGRWICKVGEGWL